MFNLKRIVHFYWRLLGDLIPLALLILLLAVLTELLTTTDSLFEILFTWEFWLAVSLNMVPAALATFGVFWLAGHFLKSVYHLNSWREGFKFLTRSRFGQSGFNPFIMVKEGKIAQGEDTILTRLGGPGHLVIRNDSAVVLERGGKLTRVLGPGFAKLEPFEKIYDVIDLRPKHWSYTVEAMTSEGIPVEWDVEVLYQIADGGQTPTENAPYPFSPEEVFRAATCKWRRETDRVQDMDWEGRVIIGGTEGILRSILAQRSLNQLIDITETEELVAREAVQEELIQALRQTVAPKLGAKILQVRLANLKVKDDITQEWIKVWKARWQSWSDIQWGKEQAKRICMYETAKAEAQVRLIEKITRALQNVGPHQPITPSILLMRLFSALDRAHLPAAARIFIPGQAIDTLEKIDQLVDGSDYFELDPRPVSNGDSNKGSGSNYPLFLQESNPREKRGPSIPQSSVPAKAIPVKRIPLIDEIAAGKETPISDEDIMGEIAWTGEEFQLDRQLLQVKFLKGSRVSFSPDYDYYAVQVSGDSMDCAGIAPGDYVILQRANLVPVRPASGDIVAVVFHNESENKATLKRLKILSDRVIFKPESSNPEHQPRTLSHRAFAGDQPYAAVAGIAMAVLKLNV